MFRKRRADEVHAIHDGLDDNLGDRIRARRAALSLTLSQVAARANCAKSYICSIENNRRTSPPSDKLLHKLEDALAMAPGELVRLARWQGLPPELQSEVRRLRRVDRAARRIAQAMTDAEALDINELHRLVDRLESPPLEIPLLGADAWIQTPDVRDPDAYALRLDDDDMHPTYARGDVVIFSPARPVDSGTDCCVRLGDETLFRRIYIENGSIRLQPLNSAAPPRVAPRSDLILHAAACVLRPC